LVGLTNVTFTGTLRLWLTNAPVGGTFTVMNDFSHSGAVFPVGALPSALCASAAIRWIASKVHVIIFLERQRWPSVCVATSSM
jgi:hypothetical protein